MKAAGDGVMVAYGERIAAVLLNSGLADEIVVVTLPKVAGVKKRLCGILRGTVRHGWYGLARCWMVRRYERCTEGCNYETGSFVIWQRMVAKLKDKCATSGCAFTLFITGGWSLRLNL